MKISDKPTNHILVKASTNSEWDNCDFAIITCNDAWVKCINKRLDAAQVVENVEDFQSLRFFDYSVGFYVSEEENEVFSEVEEKRWVFVELEEGEEDTFTTPESRLDCHTLSLFQNGIGQYMAYGKHTGEEFYTERIPMQEIAAFIQKHEI